MQAKHTFENCALIAVCEPAGEMAMELELQLGLRLQLKLELGRSSGGDFFQLLAYL